MGQCALLPVHINIKKDKEGLPKKSVLRNKRSHHNEKPAHRNKE